MTGSYIYPNGQMVSCAYNDDNQMAGIRCNDMVENACTFRYNESGDVSEVTDGLSGLHTMYDGDEHVEQRTCYIADPEGNLIEIGSWNKPFRSWSDKDR